MFQGELMSSDIKMPLKKKKFLFKIKKSTCGITSYILVVCNKGEGERGRKRGREGEGGRGTGGQGDRGTRGQGDKGTGGQGDRGDGERERGKRKRTSCFW